MCQMPDSAVDRRGLMAVSIGELAMVANTKFMTPDLNIEFHATKEPLAYRRNGR